MAKVRVYELARELDMESKELVDKLNAGGMIIKNYMSTLDEQSIARARKIVSGIVSQVVEEKRIKSTVIRRRKKVIKVEQPSPEIQEVEEPLIGSTEIEAAEPPSEIAVEPEEKTHEEETAQEEIPREIPSQEIPPEEHLPEKTPLKEPIISESAETTSAEEEIPAKTAAPEKEMPSPPEETGKAEPVEEEPPKETGTEAIQEEPVIETEEPGQDQDLTTDKTAESLRAPKPKTKKGKKKKTAQPARIIKRPEEGPLKDLLARQEKEKEALSETGVSPEPPKTPVEPAIDIPPTPGKWSPSPQITGSPGRYKTLQDKAGKTFGQEEKQEESDRR